MDKNLQDTAQVAQVDTTRRRLTKAGLAVPAVLGTLASKHVLGDIAHGCTMSGQVSGNVSTHGKPVTCVLGDSPAKWESNENHLPASLSKNDTFKSLGFSDLFQRTASDNDARITDVLSGNFKLKPGKTAVSDWKELAQAALASYLSAKNLGSGFPIGDTTVVLMFNLTVVPTGLFTPADWLRPSVQWDYVDVLCYFKLLYGGVASCRTLSA